MAEYPLLILPQPTQSERQKRGSGPSGVTAPSPRRQVERLAPRFRVLEEAFEKRRARLTGSLSGQTPEQVLVLETIGSVDEFVRAVRRIPGLDWLGELDIDNLEPDDEFYFERERTRGLSGRLYLIMSNQEGMSQLRSLWRTFREDPDHPRFAYGRTRWRDVFRILRDIREWGPRDRLSETGLLEDWQQRYEEGRDHSFVEVELWCRGTAGQREASEASVRQIITETGGEVVGQALVPEIAYHAILSDLPLGAVGQLVSSMDGALVNSDHVMLLKPSGQARVSLPEPGEEQTVQLASTPGTGAPVVAVLDGLPLENHRALAGRVIVDDPDNWADEYQVGERRHGTAVSSVVLNGDLSNPTPSSRPIYVRPIMKPSPEDFRRIRDEMIPAGVLPVDIVYRALRRMLAGEGASGPTAPTVRIVNLSVGDSRRQLELGMSPWARLVDYLSWRYSILFIISAGNHWDPLDLDVDRNSLATLIRDPATLEEKILKAIASTRWNRRLRPPSEAINAVTVGATHDDNAGAVPLHNRINPFVRSSLASVISASGPGFRRSVKPEVMMPGGRQLLAEVFGNAHRNVRLRVAVSSTGPGVRVAAPGGAPTDMDATTFHCGTSHAAAHATHMAGRIYDEIEGLRASPGGANLPANTVPLVKTLLVHQGEVYEDGMMERVAPGLSRHLLGYGPSRDGIGLFSLDHRATMIGVGEIEEDEGLVFRIPLPPSLSGKAVWRRIAITLAWLTPTVPRSRAYRSAKLWFTPYGDGQDDSALKNLLVADRIGADWQAVQRGTVQHEVFEGTRASTFVDGDELKVKVNCRVECGELNASVPFGLAVTLEVAQNVGLPIYQEIKARIPVPVRVETR